MVVKRCWPSTTSASGACGFLIRTMLPREYGLAFATSVVSPQAAVISLSSSLACSVVQAYGR